MKRALPQRNTFTRRTRIELKSISSRVDLELLFTSGFRKKLEEDHHVKIALSPSTVSCLRLDGSDC